MFQRIRGPFVALVMLACAACAGLPPDAEEVGDGSLRLVRNEEGLRLRVAAGWEADAFPAPELRDIVIEAEPALTDEAATRQAALALPLREAFAVAPGPLQVALHLRGIKPVSPGLNVLTTVLVLWPLDTGSLWITATVRDASGRVLAVRDERIRGRLRDVGKAFDPYAHLHAALRAWGARCAQWPHCFSAALPQP